MDENKLVLRMLKMIEDDIIIMKKYIEPERLEGMEHVKRICMNFLFSKESDYEKIKIRHDNAGHPIL
jgi:hypothetical protein